MQTIGGGPEWKGWALSGDYLKVEELLLIKFADDLIIKKKKVCGRYRHYVSRKPLLFSIFLLILIIDYDVMILLRKLEDKIRNKINSKLILIN